MSAEKVFMRVQELSNNKPIMVSLSGGNPAIQNLEPLINLGHKHNYRFNLETQGSIAQDWFAKLDILTLSPKPPSSGMDTDYTLLDACFETAKSNPQIALKIVIMNDEDYKYAHDLAKRYPDTALYLQPANHTPPDAQNPNQSTDLDGIMDRMKWLVDKVTEDQWFDVHVLPQLHVLLWGNERGV